MSLQRISYLIKKELLQIKEDKSVFIVVFILPIMLILIYGFGINMDIKPIRLSIVNNSDNIISSNITSEFLGSKYFKLTTEKSLIKAQAMLKDHTIDAIVYIKDDIFKRVLSNNLDNYQGINIFINGTDGQKAQLIRSYIEQTLSLAITNLSHEKNLKLNFNSYNLIIRQWFNDSNESAVSLMPGQLIGIITLIAAFISSIVIAKEWDRHTINILKTTNITIFEFFLSKLIPYYILSLIGAFVSFSLTIYIFNLPVKGSLFIMVLCVLVYVLDSVLLGLLFSAIAKNQFLANEAAIIVSFLPSILLSGALFDLRAVPQWISVIGHLMPPTYAVESMKICFLSGGATDLLWRNIAILLIFTVVFSLACLKLIAKNMRE